jgi:AraC family transcriptional regulator
MNTLQEIIQRINYSIDFVEENIFKPVSSIEMAQAAGYSLFHFQRMFKDTTGITPKAYLRARRLTMAAQELRGSDTDIVYISEDAGFGSQASFTKAFSKQYGIAPGKFRKSVVQANCRAVFISIGDSSLEK